MKIHLQYNKLTNILLVLLFIACHHLSAQCPNLTNCTSIRYIRVNFHFMLKDDNTGNYNEFGDNRGNSTLTAYKYAQDLVTASNLKLANNVAMEPNVPSGYSSPQVCAIKIRYILCDVYLHRNSSFYYYSLNGFNYNWGDPKWMGLYGKNKSSEVNVFVVNSATTTAGGNASAYGGQAGDSYILLASPWDPTFDMNVHSGNFNHEMGHILNLYHVFEEDYTDDTPVGQNGTLNVMDYCISASRKCQQAYTPNQLTRMYNYLSSSLPNYAICCSGIPVTAIFSMPETVCSGETVYIDGSWRDSNNKRETSYTIKIFEVATVGSTTAIGTIKTIPGTGQYGKINLSSQFTFASNKIYSVTLTVTSTNANTCGPHSSTKYLKTSSSPYYIQNLYIEDHLTGEDEQYKNLQQFSVFNKLIAGQDVTNYSAGFGEVRITGGRSFIFSSQSSVEFQPGVLLESTTGSITASVNPSLPCTNNNLTRQSEDNYGKILINRDNEGLIVSPIPFNDYLNIEFNESEYGTIEISLINTLGQESNISNIDLKNQPGRLVYFNTQQVQPGIYNLYVRSSNGVKKKLVLKY